MNYSDNYLEINDQNERHFESLYKQIIRTDKWSKPETQQVVEDSKIVGFCLKSKDSNTEQKIFVNFCHSSMMKSPTLDLNEEELRSLLASEDPSSFTIPLVITQLKSTQDKIGTEALVCDVIINTDFYLNKIINSQLYKTFLITVTLETIEKDKYNGIIDKNDWVLLKNKKYQELTVNDKSDKIIANELSALLSISGNNHHFNDNYLKTKSNYITGPETDSLLSQLSKQKSQTIRDEKGVINLDNKDSQLITPKYQLKLYLLNNCLEGQLILPNVYHTKQLSLQIGEDRIVLKALNYYLDIFVPVIIKPEDVTAQLNSLNNTLIIKMSLI